MTESAKLPISDRMGNGITEPAAAHPRFVGFLKITKSPRSIVKAYACTPELSSGLSRNDFHIYAGRRFWCVFETAPEVGSQCVVAISGIDRLGGPDEPHSVRLLVSCLIVESNNAETRYRERRGLDSDTRNVAGQFHVVAEFIGYV